MQIRTGRVLGLDIGGANLKAADSSGNACGEVFEIWRAPGELADRLRELIGRFSPPDALAVTMTAELADCFATKAEGVAFIVAAVQEAAGATPVAVWSTAGEFVPPETATARPIAVAAANWHALATRAGQLASRDRALLVDIGSTTADIIPLKDGRPVPRGLTDFERLRHHELVYMGVRRTPLCAIAGNVPVRGRPCAVAAELFATAQDVYLLLGLVAEDPDDCHTADGRPATIACAHDRIARMVCCDRDEIGLDEARAIAGSFAAAQENALLSAIDEVASREAGPVETVVISGSGEWLAARLVAAHPLTRGARVVALSSILSPSIAEAACAHAVAVLKSARRHCV